MTDAAFKALSLLMTDLRKAGSTAVPCHWALQRVEQIMDIEKAARNDTKGSDTSQDEFVALFIRAERLTESTTIEKAEWLYNQLQPAARAGQAGLTDTQYRKDANYPFKETRTCKCGRYLLPSPFPNAHSEFSCIP